MVATRFSRTEVGQNRTFFATKYVLKYEILQVCKYIKYGNLHTFSLYIHISIHMHSVRQFHISKPQDARMVYPNIYD